MAGIRSQKAETANKESILEKGKYSQEKKPILSRERNKLKELAYETTEKVKTEVGRVKHNVSTH